jgi:hypothetical protein
MKMVPGESMNYELIENADIVRFIKSRRIARIGHVMRMDDKRRVETYRYENQRKTKEKMDCVH